MVIIKLTILFSILFLSSNTYSKKASIEDYISNCLIESEKQMHSAPLEQTFDGIVISPNHKDSTFDIELKIHFRLESFVGESIKLIPLVEQSMNNALDAAERFYHHYGLNLKIIASYDITQDYMPAPVPSGSKLVYLRPYRGETMNVLRWGLNSNWSDERRAKIYVHELTHFFDIPDEYKKDHGLNSIETMEDDSFMNKWDHPKATMYLRHVKAILKNNCST